MTTRIFACVLLTMILSTNAWAFRYGLPYQFKLSKDDTVDYSVSGGSYADYKVIKIGDENVAIIEPKTISKEDVGWFKILAVGNGSTEFKIEREGATKTGRCTVEVTVAE